MAAIALAAYDSGSGLGLGDCEWVVLAGAYVPDTRLSKLILTYPDGKSFAASSRYSVTFLAETGMSMSLKREGVVLWLGHRCSSKRPTVLRTDWVTSESISLLPRT